MEDELLCALCLYAISFPTVVVDGLNVPQDVYGIPLLRAIKRELEPGALFSLNMNSHAGLYPVTQVRGTLVCLGHIQEALMTGGGR
jgi:hypothetical protein